MLPFEIVKILKSEIYTRGRIPYVRRSYKALRLNW
jgi:hypothetical protein